MGPAAGVGLTNPPAQPVIHIGHDQRAGSARAIVIVDAGQAIPRVIGQMMALIIDGGVAVVVVAEVVGAFNWVIWFSLLCVLTRGRAVGGHTGHVAQGIKAPGLVIRGSAGPIGGSQFIGGRCRCRSHCYWWH